MKVLALTRCLCPQNAPHLCKRTNKEGACTHTPLMPTKRAGMRPSLMSSFGCGGLCCGLLGWGWPDSPCCCCCCCCCCCWWWCWFCCEPWRVAATSSCSSCSPFCCWFCCEPWSVAATSATSALSAVCGSFSLTNLTKHQVKQWQARDSHRWGTRALEDQLHLQLIKPQVKHRYACCPHRRGTNVSSFSHASSKHTHSHTLTHTHSHTHTHTHTQSFESHGIYIPARW